MVAELVAASVLVIAGLAEAVHIRRCRRLAALAFGPTRKPRRWVGGAPFLRALAASALAWGLVSLFFAPPKVHHAQTIKEGEERHLVLVLDVSPSMRLEDAGPSKEQSRSKRAADVMESFFQRIVMEQYRISIVAVYNGAKPVVVDTRDVEVVNNILADLPMHYAFRSGKTDVFAGLKEAARIAQPWNPKSTTLMLISDGDTVPATGMPKMPASISDVLVVGVGDPVTGKFIDGRLSRQDASTLRQIALRLGGTYHDGNERHIASDIIAKLGDSSEESPLQKLTRREYALIAILLGASILALLPLALHYLGTGWRPGVPARRELGTQSRSKVVATTAGMRAAR